MIPVAVQIGARIEIHGVALGTALNQLPSGTVVVSGADGEHYLVSAPRKDRAWLLIERL